MRNWLLLGGTAIALAGAFFLSKAQTGAVTDAELQAALKICRAHIGIHEDVTTGENLLDANGWRHCAVLRQAIERRRDRAEMNAAGAAAEEASDADKKTTRDIVRRLEAK